MAVTGSGTTIMSLSLMACHPRMLEPSKPSPSSKMSGVTSLIGIEKCCQVPGKVLELEVHDLDVLAFDKVHHFFRCHAKPSNAVRNARAISLRPSPPWGGSP